MKKVLETYFNIINDYWKQKGLSSILESNENIINILDFYIQRENLHIDMNKSGWTTNKKFIIALLDTKNILVGYITITKNDCNVFYKNKFENIDSLDNFTLNENMNGYFIDSYNLNGNNIEHITEFNENSIFLSNGVVPYLSHNMTSKFSEAYSIHKTEKEKIKTMVKEKQKQLIKSYQQ